MLKDCYLLYLRDRGYPCWPRASRRSRIIRNKWNAPELEAAYFLRLCQNSTDRHYANVMNILLEEILHMLITLRRPSARSTLPKTVFKTIRAFSKGYLKKPPGPYKINMQSP